MNYDVEFIIVGGTLKVKAQVMALEMLKRDSLLRSFAMASKEFGKPPRVSKDDQWVTIDFTNAEVPLKSGLQEAFEPIKRKYRGQVVGSVTCLMKYTIMQGVSLTTVEFPAE